MNPEDRSARVTTRRQFLRSAAFAVGASALVAACGTSGGTERDRTPDTSNGRQGNEGGDTGDGGDGGD